jgi:hypothetical protein
VSLWSRRRLRSDAFERPGAKQLACRVGGTGVCPRNLWRCRMRERARPCRLQSPADGENARCVGPGPPAACGPSPRAPGTALCSLQRRRGDPRASCMAPPPEASKPSRHRETRVRARSLLGERPRSHMLGVLVCLLVSLVLITTLGRMFDARERRNRRRLDSGSVRPAAGRYR